MEDLISRAGLLRSLNEQAPKPTTDDLYTVNMCIINAPAVDAAPVVHARWQGVSPFVDTEECSNCRYNIPSEEFETPYCPWCGAITDGERRDDE